MPPTAEMYTHEEVHELYRKYGTVDAVAEKLGVPAHEVGPVIDEMPLRQVYRHKGSAPTVYTDDELKALLKEAAEVCGEPLTLPAYHREAPKQGWPAALTITQRLGGKKQTWYAACQKAGVKANKPKGRRNGSITEEQCLVALRLCRADFTAEAVTHNNIVRELRARKSLSPEEKKILTIGEVAEDIEPSYERYVNWARRNGHKPRRRTDPPSGPTIRSIIGPWSKALNLAYSDDA